MSRKQPKRPVWWKNTFFLFGAALVVIGLWGLISGEKVIRDPGQIREKGLVLFYLLGGAVMLVNGWLTHVQSLKTFEEEGGEEEGATSTASAVQTDSE
ncbi:MAG: hypothetical protein R2688_03890 [Fimbriimonadaceae bacterium]